MILTLLASALVMAPYKDTLFESPRVLEARGDYSLVDYQELRDINARDEVPVQRVRAIYTSPLTSELERAYPDGTLEAGNAATAKFAVIFVHGGGGNGTLGFNDVTFGGNFNRIKHLAVENGGVYESPSFTSFNDLSPLRAILKRLPKSAPIVIGCGSAGGEICWTAYKDKAVSARVAGLILMGAQAHSYSKDEAGSRRKIPVFLAHGTSDPVFAVSSIKVQFDELQSMNQPSKLVLYESGKHGTPIRMVDWRAALNWIFGVNR